MSAQLFLVHSIALPSDWPALSPDDNWINYDFIRARDLERLECFATEHFGQRQPDLLQEIGDPSDAISRWVAQRNIDLIMMPTRGYGLFRRALIGSVTTKVLHDTSCAVWTAPHGDAILRPMYKHVLCAVDEPVRSASLLRSASELAGVFGATLTIVHSYPDFTGTPVERYERAIPERTELTMRRRLDALQRSAGTDARIVIARGEVNEVIAETARRREADLVVTGRGTFGGFLGSLRSHLYEIIRSAPCPVLVLKETPWNDASPYAEQTTRS